MPASSTLTPSAAAPAASADSSSGPDARVSRPITRRSTSSTRAAARPSASTYSGVSSLLATPRTPSVPNRKLMSSALRSPAEPVREVCQASALGVLRAFPSLLEPVLLALLLTRITREQPGLLQVHAYFGIQ